MTIQTTHCEWLSHFSAQVRQSLTAQLEQPLVTSFPAIKYPHIQGFAETQIIKKKTYIIQLLRQ